MPSIISRPQYIHGHDLIHPDDLRTQEDIDEIISQYGKESAFYKEYIFEKENTNFVENKLIEYFQVIPDFDYNVYRIKHNIPKEIKIPEDYHAIFKPLLWNKTYWGSNYHFNNRWAVTKKAYLQDYAFHGTSLEAISSIYVNGFSISHSKRQAHGNGFYFSHDFNIAQKYSTEDERGFKYILIVKLRYSEMSVTTLCSNRWIIKKTRTNYLVVPDNNMIELVGLIVI